MVNSGARVFIAFDKSLVRGLARRGGVSEEMVKEELELVKKIEAREGAAISFAGKLTRVSKFTRVLGVVSGICDAIVAGYEMEEDVKEGNTAKLAVDTTYMIGGLLLAVGFAS